MLVQMYSELAYVLKSRGFKLSMEQWNDVVYFIYKKYTPGMRITRHQVGLYIDEKFSQFIHDASIWKCITYQLMFADPLEDFLKYTYGILREITTLLAEVEHSQQLIEGECYFVDILQSGNFEMFMQL